MFFFRKNHTPFIILKFRAITSIIWFRLFNRTVRVVFYVSKWTLRLKNFFEKKSFSSCFLDSDYKTCGFRQYLFASFHKTASTCQKELFEENRWFLKRMYFSGSLIEKFGPSIEFFRRFVKTTFKVSRGKLWEVCHLEKISSQFHIPWEICGGLFRTESCVFSVLFWEKLSLVSETQNFVIQFQLWSKQKSAIFPKDNGKLRLKLH